ncbi:flagellin [Sediminibacillus massiliensis]|uniref:flagellin N-terminal helical domain-containing protein n=1 Tax=Sediminibacillus massiliensis TaxID=1926277 RepID=UPI0009888F84|nr:flagellin [Sediminibacillus massiliensis]
MIINHNIPALNNLHNLNKNSKKASQSVEKLSSGLRINKAADDAAGLAISEKMRAQIRGMDQASRNVQDGISLIQTAEAGLAQITNPPIQRMRELVIQAANDTLTTEDRKYIQEEIEQIKSSIDNIAKNTKFNDIPLLSVQSNSVEVLTSSNSFGGTRVEVSTLIGASPEETADNIMENFTKLKNGEIGNDSTQAIAEEWVLSKPADNQIKLENTMGDGYFLVNNSTDGDITYSGNWSNSFTINRVPGGSAQDYFGAAEIVDNSGASNIRDDLLFSFHSPERNSIQLQIGANQSDNLKVDVHDVSTFSLGIEDISVLTREDAENAITTIDDALHKVTSERTRFGSIQNRLEYTSENIAVSKENLTSAESRIRDVDVAKEIMRQAKTSILTQTSQAMLAQANQRTESVLQLLS